jgi:hypothetical protein
MTPADSSIELMLLLALRLKGLGEVDAVAEVHALDVDETEWALAELIESGKCVYRPVDGVMKYLLTPLGRELGEQALWQEVDDPSKKQKIQGAYNQFRGLEQGMFQVLADWQVVDGTSVHQRINKHDDHLYDEEILKRLYDLDKNLQKILEPLASMFSRYQNYGNRFTKALDLMRNGEMQYLMKPLIGSYSTLWFEFHEDLLATLGINRASEDSTWQLPSAT